MLCPAIDEMAGHFYLWQLFAVFINTASEAVVIHVAGQ